MSVFRISTVKLEAASVSEQLRLSRQKKDLSLEKIAKYLEINVRYLKALESGDFSTLPPGTYAKNYLREYALFLGLNYHELLPLFEKEKSVLGCGVKKSDFFTKLKAKQKRILFLPSIFKNIVIFASVLACLVYFGGAILKIFSPPILEVFNPPENLIISTFSIDITGYAQEESQVFINGELVANTGGSFMRTVYLRNGINIINITAEQKLGRKSVVERRILVDKEGIESELK
ncbi:helix-turn-helix domain-containing protein [Patescibacteria group bacterium]|nr:helix-turn-helix domain-containing protein [Patescibacteria group bacterium]